MSCANLANRSNAQLLQPHGQWCWDLNATACERYFAGPQLGPYHLCKVDGAACIGLPEIKCDGSAMQPPRWPPAPDNPPPAVSGPSNPPFPSVPLHPSTPPLPSAPRPSTPPLPFAPTPPLSPPLPSIPSATCAAMKGRVNAYLLQPEGKWCWQLANATECEQYYSGFNDSAVHICYWSGSACIGAPEIACDAPSQPPPSSGAAPLMPHVPKSPPLVPPMPRAPPLPPLPAPPSPESPPPLLPPTPLPPKAPKVASEECTSIVDRTNAYLLQPEGKWCWQHVNATECEQHYSGISLSAIHVCYWKGDVCFGAPEIACVPSMPPLPDPPSEPLALPPDAPPSTPPPGPLAPPEQIPMVTTYAMSLVLALGVCSSACFCRRRLLELLRPFAWQPFAWPMDDDDDVSAELQAERRAPAPLQMLLRLYRGARGRTSATVELGTALSSSLQRSRRSSAHRRLGDVDDSERSLAHASGDCDDGGLLGSNNGPGGVVVR